MPMRFLHSFTPFVCLLPLFHPPVPMVDEVRRAQAARPVRRVPPRRRFPQPRSIGNAVVKIPTKAPMRRRSVAGRSRRLPLRARLADSTILGTDVAVGLVTVAPTNFRASVTGSYGSPGLGSPARGRHDSPD